MGTQEDSIIHSANRLIDNRKDDTLGQDY